MFFTAKRPSGPIVHGYCFESSDLFAVTDATANAGPIVSAGADCARARGELTTPTAIGTAIAAPAAAASRSFLHAVSIAPGSFFMICSILFFRSEPVTPDTHASGDST